LSGVSELWLRRLLVAVSVVFGIITDVETLVQLVGEHERQMKEKFGNETEGEVAE